MLLDLLMVGLVFDLLMVGLVLQKNVEIFGPKRFTAIVFADEAAPVSREMVNTLSCSAQACLHALFIPRHCFAGQEHFVPITF